MLLEHFVNFWLDMIADILETLLPDDPAPDLGSASLLVYGYSWFNSWLPLDEAFDLAKTTVLVLVVLGGVYLVQWLLKRAHVLG